MEGERRDLCGEEEKRRGYMCVVGWEGKGSVGGVARGRHPITVPYHSLLNISPFTRLAGELCCGHKTLHATPTPDTPLPHPHNTPCQHPHHCNIHIQSCSRVTHTTSASPASPSPPSPTLSILNKTVMPPTYLQNPAAFHSLPSCTEPWLCQELYINKMSVLRGIEVIRSPPQHEGSNNTCWNMATAHCCCHAGRLFSSIPFVSFTDMSRECLRQFEVCFPTTSFVLI